MGHSSCERQGEGCCHSKLVRFCQSRMVSVFFLEDRGRAEVVSSHPRGHGLLVHSNRICPWTFPLSVLSGEGWTQPEDSQAERPSHFQTLEREPGQRKPDRGPQWQARGGGPSSLDWAGDRALGQGRRNTSKAVSSVLGRRQVWLHT